MPSLFEMLAEQIDPADVARNSNVGRAFQRKGIVRSTDFRRIERLPRRVWQDDPRLPLLVELATEQLKAPGGTMTLKPVQAQALADAHDIKGAFLPVGVGHGKTLITLLAPMVLKLKRPMLFVPPALRHQTREISIPGMLKHWRFTPPRVVGYSELSLAKNARMLEEYEPDGLILDECHNLKNPRAGRTRRVERYLRDHPQTVVIALSGTISNRSLRDYWHLLRWCLKDDWMPLPQRWREMCEWSDALDEGVEDHARVAPGALMRFAEPRDNPRQAYRRRLTETPGVVATADDELGCSLVVRTLDNVVAPPKVLGALQNLFDTWETPNGDALMEATDVARHARELVMGFYYRWEPAAPADWLAARKAWHQYVRETLKTNRRQLDTPLQVWNECKRWDDGGGVGSDAIKLEGLHAWRNWKAIKDTFKPNQVAEWVSDYAVELACDWLNVTGPEPGIVWVAGHVAFAERLAKASGCPYFGAGAKASRDIVKAKGQSFIASVAAHGEGKELQWHAAHNLLLCPMSSGKKWNQTMGRTHRKGQPADTVYFDVGNWHPVLADAFRQARADAKYLEDTGCGRQKLNYCDIVTKS